jgi:hypothetical protein
MLGYLVKKAFIALGLFLFYYLVIENILVAWMYVKVNDMGRYLPFEISDRLIPKPAFLGKFDSNYSKSLHAIPEFVVYTILLTGLIWLLCYRVHKKRDL